ALSWSESGGWQPKLDVSSKADLIIYFGARELLKSERPHRELTALFPQAHLLGCSTGGQIDNNEIIDETINALALRFDATRLKAAKECIGNSSDSRLGGEAL